MSQIMKRSQVLCFLCRKPGHKKGYCKLNKKSNVNRKRLADALAKLNYDSRHRPPSPIVRSSRDDESTQSVNNMSLIENDPSLEVVETFAVVYISNIPYNWKYRDVKKYIVDKIKWHTPNIGQNLMVIILKEKTNTTSYKVAKVILDNQEFAKIVVERLTNDEWDGNKLEVTQDPEAPFLKDVDINTTDIENEIKNKMFEIRSKSQQSNFHAAHEPARDHNFKRKDNEDNLYGLSREYLNSLGITPPLQSSIFVSGFDPEKVNYEKLREVFSLAGQVVVINIFRNDDGTPKNCATVLFDHPVEAVQAISMFRDQPLYGNNLTINLSAMSRLPEGLTKLGPGLGPAGKPMRNVRTTIELKPLKHMLHKKLTTKKPDSPTNLEKYVFDDAYFQQNAPTMAGANQTVVDPMALNAAMNTMIQTAAMTIMAQNSVMNPVALNPAMSAMTQNAAMNHMIKNTGMNPMIQNTVMNSIVLNDTKNAMHQNAALNPITHNPSINSIVLNDTMNVMTQNAAMTPITHNSSINPIVLNDTMNPMAQNSAMTPITHNPSINPIVQNDSMNPMHQNAGMNPITHKPSMNSIVLNDTMNQIHQNAGMNPITHNPSINPIVLNDTMNPMHQNAAMTPITHNPSINPIVQNNTMNPMHQNAGMNPITHNPSINPTVVSDTMNPMAQNLVMNQVTQNADKNLVAQNALSVSQMAQDHDTIDTKSINSQVQNKAEQTNSCDSEGKDNSDKENGSHILLFTNLPSSVDRRALKSKMREIGKLLFVKLMERGRAFVSYEKYKDADKCIRIFHKCKVDGQVIEVKLL